MDSQNLMSSFVRLSGKLSTKRLGLTEFKTPSKAASESRRPGLLDRPLELDGLKAFDAKLNLAAKDVADSPISITAVESTVTLENGKLVATFSGKAAGSPANGRMELRRRNNGAIVSVNAKAAKMDVGQTLKQLKMPDIVVGTADAIH